MRRSIAVILTALLLSGCGGAGEGDVKASALARRSVSLDVVPASNALDRFGGQILFNVGRGSSGNVLLSPYSLMMALLMTRVGTAGATRAELDRALRLTEIQDVDGIFNALDQLVLSRRGERAANDGKKSTVAIQTANAVWLQREYPVVQAFLEGLAIDYGAGVHLVDYKSDADGARKAINKWVSERTAAKIPALIPKGVLDALTRLVLTNAIYFKAAWAEPFPPERTATAAFVRLDGTFVDTPFMNNALITTYARGSGWQSLALPYVGNELEFDVIVPDAGRFSEIERLLTDGVRQFFDSGATSAVELSLPKFRFRFNADVVEALQAMGIVELFGDHADLSRMAEVEQLSVSDVLHEAFIDVNERGTEAAAATAVVIKATAAPAPPVKLVVDRPFFAAVRDRSSGATLFLGRVLDPARQSG